MATRRERVMEWIVRLNPVRAAYAAADTGAATNQALPNATVTLFKVFGQGGAEEQVDIGEVTTDSNGAFEITDIDAAPAGTGQATDFYYEVRITKGDLELRAPSAPGTDDTVNVTPESDLASRILSDVVVVPGEDSPPIPKADTIEALRELVIQNAADLQDSGAIAIPSALDAQADDTLLATANGLAAGGGNAEKVFKAASFEAEYLELTGDDSTTNADSAAYIKRVTREACSQAAGSYLPQTLADALGAFMNSSDNTVTLAEIISAYNDNFSGPDLAAGAQLSDFQALLEGVATKTGASADTATELSKE
ncbi:MAG: hypothetical protein IPM37_11765 [Hahellaceae bacterium]|nr:hypothetical protein [Hahellaceae bacterium]